MNNAMRKNKPKIQIATIIVNYRSEERTINYVKEELVKVTTPHIIVIINNSATIESNQKLVENLKGELVTDISIVRNCENNCYIIPQIMNLGFAKGNNLAATFSMKHFDITYFLFTNNDIRFVERNVVEKLIYRINIFPNIALIGPQVIGIDGRHQSPEPYISFWNRYVWMYWSTPFLSLNRKEKLFKLDYSDNAKEGIHYKISGSFFLMKSQDFISCGMMDPNTFLYGEELILSERLRCINKYCYYYPQVSIIHEHSLTISSHLSNSKRSMLLFESESYFYRKYKNFSSISIFLGRSSFKFYLFLNNLLKSRMH